MIERKKIGEVTELLKRGVAPTYVDEEGILIFNQKCIRNGRVNRSLAKQSSANKKYTLEKFLRDGDTLVNSTGTGTVGRSAYFESQETDGKVLADTHIMIVRPDVKSIDPRFLSYQLQVREDKIANMAKGATNQVELSASDLAEVYLELPIRSSQERISNIISQYENLIENNTRRILLLEKASRALYREWFVHLRFPGHEHAKIANGLPEGWSLEPVSNLASYVSRGLSPKYDEESEGLVINQKCIRDGKLNLGPARRQSKKVPVLKLVQAGDVLVNSTGAGTLGRVCQCHIEREGLTVDSHVTIVRPGAKVPPLWFGLSLILKEAFIETLGRGATNQTELSKDDLEKIELLVAPDSMLQEFEAIICPLIEQVNVLSGQMVQLAAARDMLLPRLMDGRIEV